MSDMFNPFFGGTKGPSFKNAQAGVRPMSADSTGCAPSFNTSDGADTTTFNHVFSAQPEKTKAQMSTRDVTLAEIAKVSKMDVRGMSTENGPLCSGVLEGMMKALPIEEMAIA